MNRDALAAELRADAREWEEKAAGVARWLTEKDREKIAAIVARLRASADKIDQFTGSVKAE